MPTGKALPVIACLTASQRSAEVKGQYDDTGGEQKGDVDGDHRLDVAPDIDSLHHPNQQPGQQNGFHDDGDAGNHPQIDVARGGAENRAGNAQQHRLRRDGVDGAVKLARGEDEQHREQEQRTQHIDEADSQEHAHRILNASARKAHTRPSPRNCGTRKKRSFA
jgi:hypothetical protein